MVSWNRASFAWDKSDNVRYKLTIRSSSPWQAKNGLRSVLMANIDLGYMLAQAEEITENMAQPVMYEIMKETYIRSSQLVWFSSELPDEHDIEKLS